jgi:hypothetical protein
VDTNDIKYKKTIAITQYLNFLRLMWTNFHFRADRLLATVNTANNTNALVRFIVYTISNQNDIESYLKPKKSVWVEKMKKQSEVGKKQISFDLNKIGIKSEVIKEMYNYGGYFSKQTLLLLLKTYQDLLKNRILTREKLEEILFQNQ